VSGVDSDEVYDVASKLLGKLREFPAS